MRETDVNGSGEVLNMPQIELPQTKLAEFCCRWKVMELSLFGSVLRDDFRSDSDVDALVKFRPDAAWSLFDHAEMREELAQLLGREVDLLSFDAVERSDNDFRRRAILDSARVIHAAA